ncbi:MAG TPA: HAD family hydrolase [Mobilitalea sp.]|nr:HAD family hydrolase [Mobilitalea sp.]
MKKAIFLDFYGTVVHEDDTVIEKITQEIFETGNAADKSEIGTYWWKEFQTLFINSYGDSFRTQRDLEIQSLQSTIQYFHSTADALQMSNFMFQYWVKPHIFDESKIFFELCKLPIYIVSNIDRTDIVQALEFHKLMPSGIFTSEDAKSYKPRKELFELALSTTGYSSYEVVHIGDSLTSDIKGANEVGIQPIWINRNNREVPKGVLAVNELTEVFNLYKW